MLFLTLNPTNHAVQFLEFRRFFGNRIGFVLRSGIELDFQKKNAPFFKLRFLRFVESALGHLAVDINCRRLDNGKKIVHRRKSTQKKNVVVA